MKTFIRALAQPFLVATFLLIECLMIFFAVGLFFASLEWYQDYNRPKVKAVNQEEISSATEEGRVS